MEMLYKKCVLLFAAAVALCAFALPSMAGAASWTVVGTEHTLDSSNIGFRTDTGPLGVVDSSCSASSFTTTVASAANLEITASSFGGTCTATGVTIGTCNMTATGLKFPWTATALSTNHVQIHGIHITVIYDQTAGGTCAIPGANLTITGTLTGSWNNASHHLTLSNATGLTGHSALGDWTLTARGTFRDTAQTLDIS